MVGQCLVCQQVRFGVEQFGRVLALTALASSSTIAADAAIASADATVAADVAARDIQFQEQPARRTHRVVLQPGERGGGARPHLGVGHGRRDGHVGVLLSLLLLRAPSMSKNLQ